MNKIAKDYINYCIRTYIRTYPNCHHRNSLGYHSLWSARAANDIINNNIYELAADFTNEQKIITLFAALFHDIGKDDDCRDETTCDKKIHPSLGSINIELKNKSGGYKFLWKIIDYISKNYNINKQLLVEYFKFISLNHQIISYIFEGKTFADQFLNNAYAAVSPGLKSNFKFLIFSLLIVCISDVVGAWHQYASEPYILDFLKMKLPADNNRFDCKDPNEDCHKICTKPWIKYGYDKKFDKKVIFPIMNWFDRDIKTENIPCALKLTTITSRTFLFKGEKDPQKFIANFDKYTKPSWFSQLIDSAMIYKREYIMGLKLKKGKKLILLNLDDEPTVIYTCGLLVQKGKSELANTFIKAFSPRQDNFLQRRSEYVEDQKIMKDIICADIFGVKVQGYIADPIRAPYHGGWFHDEIAVCNPAGLFDVVKVYKREADESYKEIKL